MGKKYMEREGNKLPIFKIEKIPIFPHDAPKSGFRDGQKWGWTPQLCVSSQDRQRERETERERVRVSGKRETEIENDCVRERERLRDIKSEKRERRIE